jgi:hypothetical protein
MPERYVRVELVAVAAAFPGAIEVTRIDQVGDDPLCGPLGYPDVIGDVTEPDVRIPGDAEKNVGVIG